MTDLNTYRQRIGTFSHPASRKFKCYETARKEKYCSLGFKFKFLHFILLCLVLYFSISASAVENFSREASLDENFYFHKHDISSKINNWYARCTYGNRRNKGLKFSHWNAGPAHLPNKLDQLEQVISCYSPHIFGISEANLLAKHNIDDVQIQDYELITAKTMENPRLQYSRVVVYKHSSIISKVRTDLMSEEFSSIYHKIS